MAGLNHNFRELKVWQMAMKVAKATYDTTSKLPAEEKIGLKSQMNRSAVSIPSNITEGSGRKGNKEFQYFLSIAISSSFELETQILLASEIFNLEVESIINQIHETQRMIAGLKKSLGE